MAATPEDMREQCEECSSELEVGQIGKCGSCQDDDDINKYELVLSGFDGGSDDTDDRIITVETTMGRAELEAFLAEHHIADKIGEICDYPAILDVDFNLPDGIDALKKQIEDVLGPKKVIPPESVARCEALVINAPGFFADSEFKAWLNNGEPKFTWHKGGEPGEWSDVVVLVDTGLGGEGTDSDMPEHIWNQIVEACRKHLGTSRGDGYHYMVRLTNVS